MYKTIRHGENSLQYKILPQNDDFRIEGKMSTAESSCSSNNRKSKAKRPKRRSFFAYLGLIFVCTVIVGAVLIPFLVSAECLPNPTEWFLKTKAAFTRGGDKHGSDTTKDTASNIKSNVYEGAQRPVLYGNGVNIGKTVKIINKDGVEKIILRVNKTADSQPVKIPEKANSTINDVAYPPDTKQNKSLISILNKKAGNVNERDDDDGKATAASELQQHLGSETGQQSDLDTQPNAGATRPEIDASDAGIVPVERPAKTLPNEIGRENILVANVGLEQPKDNADNVAPPLKGTTLRDQYDNNYETTKIQQQQIQPLSAVRPTPAYSQLPIVNSPHAPANNQGLQQQQQHQMQNNSTSPAVPTIVTRIIQVPLLKSAAKKPIIPPVLVKTNSQLSLGVSGAEDSDGEGTSDGSLDDINVVPTIIKHKQNSDWIKTHWPYIDPSTYFQWTGYKAEDSVLLPALLGFALIGVILIITVCLVARNKRTIVSSVRRRNRNDIEETGAEDNTTLLATNNLSDED